MRSANSFAGRYKIVSCGNGSCFFCRANGLPNNKNFKQDTTIRRFGCGTSNAFPVVGTAQRKISPMNALGPCREIRTRAVTFSRNIGSRPGIGANMCVSRVRGKSCVGMHRISFNGGSPGQFATAITDTLHNKALRMHASDVDKPLVTRLAVPSAKN